MEVSRWVKEALLELRKRAEVSRKNASVHLKDCNLRVIGCILEMLQLQVPIHVQELLYREVKKSNEFVISFCLN